MGLFDFMTKQNDSHDTEIEERNNHYKAMIKAQIVNGGDNDFISESEVLKIPAVQSIVEIIGGTIAQLPIYLYKDMGDGSIVREVDYREDLLNDEPNKLQTAYNLKKNMVKDYLLHGKHYIYKSVSNGEVEALYGLESKNVLIKRYYKNGFVADATITLTNQSDEDIKAKEFDLHELIAILKDSPDGVISRGALYYGYELFQVIQKEEEYTRNIYENGAMPLGILKSEGRLTQPTIDRMRNSWQNLYSGSKNVAKTIILEEGLDYKPVSLNPKDLLLTETRKEHLSEICRLFNIPESLINPNANKYGSLEQNNIAFLQYTLSPIISAIENALNKSLLTPSEKKDGYFFSFDTAEVLRTTEKERYEAIKVGLDTGVITMNEARYKLNLKGINDDIMKWSLGAVLYYPETGEMKIPNLGIGIEGYNKNGEVTPEPEKTEKEVVKTDKEGEE